MIKSNLAKWIVGGLSMFVLGYVLFIGTPLDELRSGIGSVSLYKAAAVFLQPLTEWGGGTMYQEAFDHLRERGFVLLPDFSWLVPYGFEVTERDCEAVLYLAEKWDFKCVIHFAPPSSLH